MSDDLKSEGGYTVVPGQVRALSKEGKAWFTATARNAGASAKKNRVPQDLAEGKRACTDAKKDPSYFSTEEFRTRGPRPSRYDSHVDTFRAIEAEITWSAVWERVKDSYTRHCDEQEKAEKQASYLHEHRPSTAHRHASWFAFDDTGKVVLSLRVTRERALDIALGYNEAGGRLVLLSPEPILDDADVNDCVAIPDARPPVEPVREDPLITFAGEDGILVRTAHGTVAFDRYTDGKAATNRVLCDPTREGPAYVTRLGDKAHPSDPIPDNVEDWLRQLAEATPAVLHTGPASKLPRPGVVRFKKTPESKLLIFTPPGFPPVMVDPAQVREVVAGSKLVRVEVVPFGEVPVVRVVRADGLVGYLSWFQNVVQYTTNEGRTVVVA